MNNIYLCEGQKIKLEIRGYEMDNGFNLYYLNRTFSNLQGILDKAFLTYYPSKTKMVDKDRQVLQVKVMSFQKGSLISDIVIFLVAAQQATLPFGVPFTPQLIWELVKQAYEYLNFVLQAFENGQTIQMHEGDNGMNVLINGDNNQINIYPQAQELSNKAIEEIYSLASSIDEKGGIKEIKITDNRVDSKPIIFNEKSKNLLKPKKRLLEQPAQIVAQIFRLDGHSLTGKLRVIDSNDPYIKPGNEYSFLLDEEYILESCKEAFMEQANITALKEIIFNPSDFNETLNRLKIISVTA